MRASMWTTLAASASAAALIAGAALAAPPPADTVIGNQASATYEANGETFVIQSNLVETIVNEIYGLTLAAGATKSGAPGGAVFFPHTITNNGNAEDTFNLTVDPTAAGDAFALTGIEIFPDADADGQPDSLTPLSVTPSILAGETYGVVVRATLPAAATLGATSDFEFTATSTNDAAQTETNTDVVTASTDGIVELTKAQSLLTDADGNGVISVGDVIEVQLSYQNTGVGTATNVVIEDILPNTNDAGEAIDLDYNPNSAVWSLATGTPSDASDGNDLTSPQGDELAWEWNNNRTLQATLPSVPAGRSGQITFSYTITDAPDGVFSNVATVESDAQPPTDTNPVPTPVNSPAAVVLADAAATAPTPGTGIDVAANLDAGDASTTDTDGALDDIVEDTTDAYPGQSLNFDYVLTNLGNGTDTFTLSVADAGANGFPAGTVFDVVGTDGLSPIVGDELILAAGATEHVQVRVILPLDAAPVAAPANYNAVFTAVSGNDPTQSNTSAVLFNGSILAPEVDIENIDAIGGTGTGGAGIGAVDNAGAPFNTETVNPGETAVFPLRLTIAAGSPSNNFDLLASTDNTPDGDGRFSTLTLPDGWSVTFYDASGVPVTNTGPLVPTAGTDATFDYEARVTIAPNAPATLAPGQNVFFQAFSPTNSTSDSKMDAVIVNEVSDLRLTSDTVGQVQPGGFAVYEHTLTNDGNTTVTGAPLTLDTVERFVDDNMTPTLFYDANNNGVLDPSDPQITDVSEILGVDDPATPEDESTAGLSPGETAKLFLRVNVPGDAPVGTTGTGDVSVGDTLTTPNGTITDTDPGNNIVDHILTVSSGDVEVIKRQAVDATCDGVADGPLTTNQQSADPGQCVVYEITVDNVGVTPADNTVIGDVTPNYTTFEDCASACDPSVTLNGSPLAGAPSVRPAAAGDTGAIVSSGPTAGFTLPPAGRAVMTFTVRIDE